MLKRAGYIIVILFVLLGTTGFTITRHYCGTTLTHTYIFSPSHNCCGEKCPGCHNEKTTLKVTDQFTTSGNLVDFSSAFKTLIQQHSLPTLLAFSNPSAVSLLNKAPGDLCIKRAFPERSFAGHSTAYLQVFLF